MGCKFYEEKFQNFFAIILESHTKYTIVLSFARLNERNSTDYLENEHCLEQNGRQCYRQKF